MTLMMHAVMAAVFFLGEPFSAINALGLAVLLSGVSNPSLRRIGLGFRV